jgi:hypothetical protein
MNDPTKESHIAEAQESHCRMHHPDAEVKSTFAYVPAGNDHGRAHTASGSSTSAKFNGC